MNLKQTHIKRSLTKTLLIILGVIIAIIMTLNSPLFSAQNHLLNDQPQETSLAETHEEDKNNSAGEIRYNSGTRLLHLLTNNLPYLNHK